MNFAVKHYYIPVSNTTHSEYDAYMHSNAQKISLLSNTHLPFPIEYNILKVTIQKQFKSKPTYYLEVKS